MSNPRDANIASADPWTTPGVVPYGTVCGRTSGYLEVLASHGFGMRVRGSLAAAMDV